MKSRCGNAMTEWLPTGGSLTVNGATAALAGAMPTAGRPSPPSSITATTVSPLRREGVTVFRDDDDSGRLATMGAPKGQARAEVGRPAAETRRSSCVGARRLRSSTVRRSGPFPQPLPGVQWTPKKGGTILVGGIRSATVPASRRRPRTAASSPGPRPGCGGGSTSDRPATPTVRSLVTVQVLAPRVVSGDLDRGVKDRSVTAPSYEQLAALVAAQERTIAQLQARIAEQDARIAELERQLAASSRNSSQPPSSDGLDKPAPKSLRGRSGRKPGGQPGHPGRTLRRVGRPDEGVVHERGACAGGGSTLTADGPPARIIRRQVFDIPQITVRVVEHRLISRRCACGTLTCAAGPAGVTAPVQYGPSAGGVAVFWCLAQHLPVERTAFLLAELFGTPMAAGTVAAWTARAAAGLAPFTAAARTALTDAQVLHLDETGLRVAGRLHWL